MTKIEQRRKLLEAATPGPWRNCDDFIMHPDYDEVIIECLDGNDSGDAALIVAMVNDYAALLEGQKALKAVRVFIQDSIERTADATVLANLYASRDAIDDALAKFEEKP